MKKICVFIIIFIVFLVVFLVLREKKDYDIFENQHAVCHGFGAIDGIICTNSLEAFYHNYEKGHRIFEVDFMTTKDNYLVCGHDWNLFYKMAGIEFDEQMGAEPLMLSEFKSYKLCGKYTPISAEEMVLLMKEYKDIYIVTDTKNSGYELPKKDFEKLYYCCEKVNKKILNRIIPQIYNEEMLLAVNEVYEWKNIIYTLYHILPQDYEGYLRALDFSYDNGIKYVTTNMYYNYQDEFFQKVRENDIKIFMHTYNDIYDVIDHIDRYNIYGAYTDEISAEEINSLYDSE